MSVEKCKHPAKSRKSKGIIGRIIKKDSPLLINFVIKNSATKTPYYKVMTTTMTKLKTNINHAGS